MSTMLPKYIVKTSSAKMPSKCFGRYANVAVIELTEEGRAKPGAHIVISDRAKAVARVVRTWERVNVGTTTRSAYHRALAEARALAEQLNADA